MTRLSLHSIGIPLLLLFLGISTFAARVTSETTYNGHWWLSISRDERDGFLNGYFDCYKYDYKGPARFTEYPPDRARALVTHFYEVNAADLGQQVPNVFYRFRDRPGQTRTDGGGEPIRGRHGYYGGQYWGMLGEEGELGYVEGYLWCWKKCLHNKGATFSKSPKEYVALISKWYGLNYKTGDIDAEREPAKIADVLYKFRDRKQTAQTSEK